jgi:hypothetical protein
MVALIHSFTILKSIPIKFRNILAIYVLTQAELVG